MPAYYAAKRESQPLQIASNAQGRVAMALREIVSKMFAINDVIHEVVSSKGRLEIITSGDPRTREIAYRLRAEFGRQIARPPSRTRRKEDVCGVIDK